MVAVDDASAQASAIEALERAGERAWRLGSVVSLEREGEPVRYRSA
jgi:hypothetical protein